MGWEGTEGKKDLNFNHDFCYTFPLFFSLLKKEKKGKGNQLAKIVIKMHTFQTGRVVFKYLNDQY